MTLNRSAEIKQKLIPLNSEAKDIRGKVALVFIKYCTLLHGDLESLGAHVEAVERLDGIAGAIPAAVGDKSCNIVLYESSTRSPDLWFS